MNIDAPKKTYQVELKRVSYINMEVEAISKEDAEAQAWDDLEGRSDKDYAEWELTLCEELLTDEQIQEAHDMKVMYGETK